MPDAAALPERLSSIAVTAYLAFTAGYAPGSGPDPVRVDLAGEAVRLTRTVHRLRPDDPTLSALLALMLLQHSRRDARTDSTGALVLLPDQDRSLWRRDEIDEALGLLTSAPLQQALSAQAAAYLLQALIAREHAVAAEADQTRWDRIVEHYDALLPGSHRLAAVRAELLARSGDRAGSLESFDEAIELCRNDAERRHLEGRREAMAAS